MPSSADEGSASEPAAPSTRRKLRKNKHRSNKPSTLAATGGSAKGGGSVLWTVLVVGLLLSLVDVCYMIWLVDRHTNDAAVVESPVASPAQKETSEQVVSKDDPSTNRHSSSDNKGPILEILKRAGIDSSQLDEETMEALPTWDGIVKLYGAKPIVYGLDRCETFQAETKKLGFIGTAGTCEKI